jgi:hypothetical protein
VQPRPFGKATHSPDISSIRKPLLQAVAAVRRRPKFMFHVNRSPPQTFYNGDCLSM